MSAADPIRAHGVAVDVDGIPVLRDISLDVRAGEALAILGGNGAGKTTLVRTLLGLQRATRGSVELFGTPVHQFRSWARVGYVPQVSSLTVSNATVREIVGLGRLSHRRPFQWLRREDRDEVSLALDTVGLADRAHWPFAALSGGQKQRVLIARALSSRPELLVMDEPLAGVDLHSQVGLAELLGRLHARGLTMTVVLHEQGPLEPLIQRSITLCDGRISDHLHPQAPDCHPSEQPQPVLTAPFGGGL